MSLIDSLFEDPNLISQIGQEQEAYMLGNKSYDRRSVSGLPASEFQIYGANCRLHPNNQPRLWFNDITFQIVKWLNGYITLFESPKDALSFQFTGCVMARFKWGGRWYAAHIHNADPTTANLDRRLTWEQFVIRQHINQIVMFQPGANLQDPADNSIETWGVITSNQQCYTIYARDITPRSGEVQYTIDKIMHHQGMGQDAGFYRQILNHPNGTPYKDVRNAWNQFWEHTSQPEQVHGAESRCRI